MRLSGCLSRHSCGGARRGPGVAAVLPQGPHHAIVLIPAPGEELGSGRFDGAMNDFAAGDGRRRRNAPTAIDASGYPPRTVAGRKRNAKQVRRIVRVMRIATLPPRASLGPLTTLRHAASIASACPFFWRSRLIRQGEIWDSTRTQDFQDPRATRYQSSTCRLTTTPVCERLARRCAKSWRTSSRR